MHRLCQHYPISIAIVNTLYITWEHLLWHNFHLHLHWHNKQNRIFWYSNDLCGATLSCTFVNASTDRKICSKYKRYNLKSSGNIKFQMNCMEKGQQLSHTTISMIELIASHKTTGDPIQYHRITEKLLWILISVCDIMEYLDLLRLFRIPVRISASHHVDIGKIGTDSMAVVDASNIIYGVE